MKKSDIVDEWLKRAKSNLAIARPGRKKRVVLYEDLCFECQQAVEKSLKALISAYGDAIPKTHSIGKLLATLEDHNIRIPDPVKESVILSDYAVQARYPGDYEHVTKEEYTAAVKLAQKVFTWVNNIIKEMKSQKKLGVKKLFE